MRGYRQTMNSFRAPHPEDSLFHSLDFDLKIVNAVTYVIISNIFHGYVYMMALLRASSILAPFPFPVNKLAFVFAKSPMERSVVHKSNTQFSPNNLYKVYYLILFKFSV